jgi:predicted Zn-dependent protease
MAPSARDAFGHYRRGDFRSAERAARQALATAPNNPGLLQLLASALAAQGKAKEVVKHLEAVLKAGRATGETLYNLGTTLFRLVDPTKRLRGFVKPAPRGRRTRTTTTTWASPCWRPGSLKRRKPHSTALFS